MNSLFLIGLCVAIVAPFVCVGGSWSRMGYSQLNADGTVTTTITEVDEDGPRTISRQTEECGGEGCEGEHSNGMSVLCAMLVIQGKFPPFQIKPTETDNEEYEF